MQHPRFALRARRLTSSFGKSPSLSTSDASDARPALTSSDSAVELTPLDLSIKSTCPSFAAMCLSFPARSEAARLLIRTSATAARRVLRRDSLLEYSNRAAGPARPAGGLEGSTYSRYMSLKCEQRCLEMARKEGGDPRLSCSCDERTESRRRESS